LLSEIAEYRMVGPIEDAERARIEQLAISLGFRRLTLTGPVDDPQLEAELAAADVICCLRHPVLEGSSASAIEGLLSGRPVVVADAGFYAELPDDLVLKVPQQVPAPALAQALEAAAADEPGRRSMGRRARAWAQEAFSLAPYADAVLSLCEAARVARPWHPVASRFGTELARLGFEPEDPVVRRIGAILDGLVRSA
jgi:glycosyltransferase involved in cell wall biosynthesis